MNMNGVANEVMFEHITEMKVMEQAMWAQGKSIVLSDSLQPHGL